MNASWSLDVLNLADGAFPTGAHGHSAGLEYAIQAGWVFDRPTFAAWARRALRTAVLPLDVRAALKAWYAGQAAAGDRVRRWTALNAELAAFRTSRLQREASAQVGRSFLRSVQGCYGHRARGLDLDVQFPIAWGAAFSVLDLPADALASTLVFGVLRQWTQVVVRIVPLGQKDAFAAQTEVLGELGRPDSGPEEAALSLESLAPGLELAGLGMENLERKYFRS